MIKIIIMYSWYDGTFCVGQLSSVHVVHGTQRVVKIDSLMVTKYMIVGRIVDLHGMSSRRQKIRTQRLAPVPPTDLACMRMRRMCGRAENRVEHSLSPVSPCLCRLSSSCTNLHHASSRKTRGLLLRGAPKNHLMHSH